MTSDADDEAGRDHRVEYPFVASTCSGSLAEQSRPGDDERWEELLADLDVDRLTDTVVLRAVSTKATGPSGTRADLWRTVRLLLQTIIENLRAGEWADTIAEVPDRGASQRKPGADLATEELVSGHFLSVLWGGLVGAATPNDAELLIRHTPELFIAVEDNCHALALRPPRVGGQDSNRPLFLR